MALLNTIITSTEGVEQRFQIHNELTAMGFTLILMVTKQDEPV